MRDRFGITQILPTAGRDWSAAWDRGVPRVVVHPAVDTEDSQFHAKGDATVSIDGQGVATIRGEIARMYVFDRGLTWCNVEVTFYGMRICETGHAGIQGLVVGARSEHQDASDAHPCPGTAYYGRLLYDRRAHFAKELSHKAYGPNLPNNDKIPWEGREEMPRDRWIGFKFIVRNFDHDTKVRLCLYRDLTGGENGGDWELVARATDEGNWLVPDIPQQCGYPPGLVLTRPARSVFIRNDAIREAKYKWFSIREVEANP